MGMIKKRLKNAKTTGLGKNRRKVATKNNNTNTSSTTLTQSPNLDPALEEFLNPSGGGIIDDEDLMLTKTKSSKLSTKSFKSKSKELELEFPDVPTKAPPTPPTSSLLFKRPKRIFNNNNRNKNDVRNDDDNEEHNSSSQILAPALTVVVTITNKSPTDYTKKAGIAFEKSKRDSNAILVSQILPSSPFYNTLLKVGMEIIQINELNCRGMDTDVALGLIEYTEGEVRVEAVAKDLSSRAMIRGGGGGGWNTSVGDGYDRRDGPAIDTGRDGDESNSVIASGNVQQDGVIVEATNEEGTSSFFGNDALLGCGCGTGLRGD